MQSLEQIVANNAKAQAAYDESTGTDFAVANHGTIVLLQPLILHALGVSYRQVERRDQMLILRGE